MRHCIAIAGIAGLNGPENGLACPAPDSSATLRIGLAVTIQCAIGGTIRSPDNQTIVPMMARQPGVYIMLFNATFCHAPAGLKLRSYKNGDYGPYGLHGPEHPITWEQLQAWFAKFPAGSVFEVKTFPDSI